MYTIELDVDPVTLGFDPKEVTKNADGTYTVTRRFIHAVHRYLNQISYDSYEIEGYCPCLTDNVTVLSYEILDSKGRTTYGVTYQTNDREKYNTEGRSLSNSRMNYMHPLGRGMFNRQYDTNIEDPHQEEAAAFCVSTVNGHPSNIENFQREYFEKYHIVYQKSPPSNPYDDPFLPEKFKQMLGDAYNGDKNA